MLHRRVRGITEERLSISAQGKQLHTHTHTFIHSHRHTHNDKLWSFLLSTILLSMYVYVPHAFSYLKAFALWENVVPPPRSWTRASRLHRTHKKRKHTGLWACINNPCTSENTLGYQLACLVYNTRNIWCQRCTFPTEVSSLFFAQLTLQPSFAFHKEVVALWEGYRFLAADERGKPFLSYNVR